MKPVFSFCRLMIPSQITACSNWIEFSVTFSGTYVYIIFLYSYLFFHFSSMKIQLSHFYRESIPWTLFFFNVSKWENHTERENYVGVKNSETNFSPPLYKHWPFVFSLHEKSVPTRKNIIAYTKVIALIMYDIIFSLLSTKGGCHTGIVLRLVSKERAIWDQFWINHSPFYFSFVFFFLLLRFFRIQHFVMVRALVRDRMTYIAPVGCPLCLIQCKISLNHRHLFSQSIYKSLVRGGGGKRVENANAIPHPLILAPVDRATITPWKCLSSFCVFVGDVEIFHNFSLVWLKVEWVNTNRVI